MTALRISLGAAVVAAILCVAACGGTGQAAGPFPPRPADLRIAQSPPCQALSTGQLAQLDVAAPLPRNSSGLPECRFITSDRRAWVLRVNAGVPATTYVPGDPNFQGNQLGYVEPRLTTVAGFGAVEFVNSITASNSDCVLAVDGGPDVTLLVNYLDTSSRGTLDRSVGSRAEGCAQASRMASMVIETARARVAG